MGKSKKMSKQDQEIQHILKRMRLVLHEIFLDKNALRKGIESVIAMDVHLKNNPKEKNNIVGKVIGKEIYFDIYYHDFNDYIVVYDITIED